MTIAQAFGLNVLIWGLVCLSLKVQRFRLSDAEWHARRPRARAFTFAFAAFLFVWVIVLLTSAAKDAPAPCSSPLALLMAPVAAAILIIELLRLVRARRTQIRDSQTQGPR